MLPLWSEARLECRRLKKCIDCEYFKIRQQPIKDWDTGLAHCDKHNLSVDFYNKRKLIKLVCVEERNEEE